MDGLIMDRPVDNMIPQKGFRWFFLKYAPKNAMFSGWVGDQDGDFAGLKAAITLYFHAAWDGYLNFGSDIGGYRNVHGVPGGRTKELLLRWAQVSAFVPLMENGGGGNHFPWLFDNQTVEIYRQYVVIHHELFHILYSAGTEAYAQGKPVIQPLAFKQMGPFVFRQPAFWEYTLHGNIHVSPVVHENATQQNVYFREFSGDWIDYWTGKLYKPHKIINYSVPLNITPVFWRRGALLPLNVTTDYSLYGSSASQNYTTFYIPYPQVNQNESFNLYDDKPGGQTSNYYYNESTGITFTASAFSLPPIILIDGVVASGEGGLQITNLVTQTTIPAFISLQQLEEQTIGFFLDNSINRLWVRGGSSPVSGWVINIQNFTI